MANKKRGSRKTSQPSILTAVIYARYSSHNQREESIEQQVSECTAFAQANNMNVVEVYTDSAISGKTDKRAAFQRMLRDAEKGKFQVVIAYKSNRIARNMFNAMQYETRLDKLGIKTLYCKEEFGDTAAGRFALRTMMNVNQFYSENLSEDIMRALQDNAANLRVNGRIPYGYRKGQDCRHEINPEQAEIVREIFRRVLSGEPQIDIANDLNARGIKTKDGNAWNKNSFRVMLRNDIYIGTYRFVDYEKENAVPPIISKEDFALMQNFLDNKKNPQGKHRENGDYLLTGKLFCGHCGAYMVGESGTSKSGVLHHYYACQTRRKQRTCKKETVRRDWIEKKVVELTKTIVLQDDVIEWIADSAVRFLQQARGDSDVGLIEMRLAESRKSQRNIMVAIEAGIFTATTKNRLLEVEAEITQLERNLAIAKAKNVPIEKEQIIFLLEKYRSGDVGDKQFQKKIIDSFVQKVVLFDDKIEIHYYYGEKKVSSILTAEKDSPSADVSDCSYKLSLPLPTKSSPEWVSFLLAWAWDSNPSKCSMPVACCFPSAHTGEHHTIRRADRQSNPSSSAENPPGWVFSCLFFVSQCVNGCGELGVILPGQGFVVDFGSNFLGHRHHNIRHNACINQTLSLGGEIFAHRECHSGAVGQGEGVLEISLAAGLCSDHNAGFIFLQGGGKEFGSGIGAFIAENCHGNVQMICIGFVHMLIAQVIHSAEQFPFRQQMVKYLNQFVGIAAGVVADIKNQSLSPFLHQSLNGGDGLLRTAGIEI